MDIICFRCRQPLDPGGGYCIHCGASYQGGESDPKPISAERSFLLERALELTDPSAPAFMKLSEAELLVRGGAPPAPPLGAAREMATDSEGEGSRSQAEQLQADLVLLRNGASWERGQTALALAGKTEPDVLMALLRQLSDRDCEVRVCVAYALGKSGNPLILPPLLEYERHERDPVARAQLAATLHQLVAMPALGGKSDTDELRLERGEVTEELRAEATPDLFFRRGKLHLKGGHLLKAVGDFSRSVDESGHPSPMALLHRSQVFLLMGRPLYALDDLVACPDGFEYPPVFRFHRAALVALARQVAAAAREKGLTDYARLFERRIERLKDIREPT
ncbi:MAG: HEAT repeat domain-containing protein [Deltaproteobacteria bacterium]|nr:HEAT repeat domain-containing protein [Deltaproteobacteria bacterium]